MNDHVVYDNNNVMYRAQENAREALRNAFDNNHGMPANPVANQEAERDIVDTARAEIDDEERGFYA